MKTLIVEIKDKSKNAFVMELLTSFKFLTVKEKKDLSPGERKLVKKYKKSFNESDDLQNSNKRFSPIAPLPKEL